MFLPSISKIWENIILLKIFIVLNQSCSITCVEQTEVAPVNSSFLHIR